MRGRIVRGIAGFYYVQTGSRIYECKAKGIFRKDKKKPLPGDYVEIDILDEVSLTANISAILPRTNELIRPAVANVDLALVIMAAASPAPNLNLLDRFLVTMEQQRVNCCVCFNKQDLVDEQTKDRLRESYRNTGYPVLFTSARQEEGLLELRKVLSGRALRCGEILTDQLPAEPYFHGNGRDQQQNRKRKAHHQTFRADLRQ